MDPFYQILIAFYPIRKCRSEIRLPVLCSLGLCSTRILNPVLNKKILDWSEFKVLADNIINVTQKNKFVFGWVENSLGKGEHAGYPHVHLFP